MNLHSTTIPLLLVIAASALMGACGFSSEPSLSEKLQKNEQIAELQEESPFELVLPDYLPEDTSLIRTRFYEPPIGGNYRAFMVFKIDDHSGLRITQHQHSTTMKGATSIYIDDKVDGEFIFYEFEATEATHKAVLIFDVQDATGIYDENLVKTVTLELNSKEFTTKEEMKIVLIKIASSMIPD